jgi:hypothetical protein
MMGFELNPITALRALVYHEVGHGMAAVVLGCRVTQVTVTNILYMVMSGEAKYIIPDTIPPQYRAIISMAGEAGAEMFGLHSPASGGDLSNADESLRQCKGWSRQMAKDQALRLLSHPTNQLAMKACAEELLRTNAMTGARFHQLAEEAVRQQKRNQRSKV